MLVLSTEIWAWMELDTRHILAKANRKGHGSGTFPPPAKWSNTVVDHQSRSEVVLTSGLVIPHPPSQGFSFWLRISFIPFMNSLNTRLPIVHLAHIQAQGWVKIWDIFVQGEMLSENKCNILWQRSLISRHLFISHSYYTAVRVFWYFSNSAECKM